MSKNDVCDFAMNLEENIFLLHKDLSRERYNQSSYSSFFIKDPKLRHIHKAVVRDRIVHHAVYRILYPFFDKVFIYDSYSCRDKKGTHKAVERLEIFSRKVSKNYNQNCFVLKCDIKKFFDSVDHDILLKLIKKKVKDKKTIYLIKNIIKSFNKKRGKGIPLGNLTSQLFANIYLNELDQFIKHKLKAKHYIRYCDDFLILSCDKIFLADLISPIENFLAKELELHLHPEKITIKKFKQGVDFLGYVTLPYYKVLRTRTKKRMFRKIEQKRKQLEKGIINQKAFNYSFQSYLGILSHCYSYKIKKELVCSFSIYQNPNSLKYYPKVE